VNDLKSALADALKKVQSVPPQPTNQTPKTDTTEEKSQPQAKPPTSQASAIFSTRRTGIDMQAKPAESKSNDQPAAQKTAPEKTSQSTSTAPDSKPESAQSRSDQNQPAEVKAAAIDPQVIKKMLRHNDQERTPFQ